VGEQEPVHAHHHRVGQLLGDPEGLDVQVGRFLAGLGVGLDPAASRWLIASLWSFQMLIGAPIARLATVITTGRPSPAAL
jgi:hypothetical protein